MNLHLIDWLIVLVFTVFIIGSVVVSRKYMRSVADFLSAGRAAGRHLVAISSGIASLGAITIIAQFEMFFKAGFPMQWWNFSQHFFVMIVAISGWVMYRFRETRALTLAQFFEMRYSRSFRIASGVLAFISGIINFGIFPAVGARFFLYYCGFPEYFSLMGIDISTFAVLMIVLLSVSIYFVFAGGQIAVLVTDFFQGIFVSMVFIVICIYLLGVFEPAQIFETLQQAPEDASKLNPFKTGQAEDFNVWYFLFGIIGLFYGPLTWQGSQGINSSAKDAHEAKMGQVLSYWRLLPQTVFLVFVPICAFTLLNSGDFGHLTAAANAAINGIAVDNIQTQMTVPLVLVEILPVGLLGCFAAVMLAAFISTHDTYLHSWASIFIQDVVMPIRQKPLPPEEHIRWIRYTIIAIAIFIFMFSLLYVPNQFILLFFAITGSIFMSGAGAAIVFGLYWKRGTTAGAWSALICGAVVSVLGLVLNQAFDDFPINEVWFGIIAILSSCLIYVIVSLMENKEFNLDKMLHRGEYAIEGERRVVNEAVSSGWRVLGIGKEFSKWDRYLYIVSYIWIFFWLGAFMLGAIYHFTTAEGMSDAQWMDFWWFFLYSTGGMAVLVIIMFLIGGIKDIREMFHRLSTMERDENDDGSVS